MARRRRPPPPLARCPPPPRSRLRFTSRTCTRSSTWSTRTRTSLTGSTSQTGMNESRRAFGPPISYYDMLQLTGQILVDLGDGHSTRLSPGEYAHLTTKLDDSTLNTTAPSGKVLAGGIGYLTIPAVIAAAGSGAYDSYVAPAHQLLQQTACAWIIDLRGNNGGSVPPMMAAVAPLLGPGTFLGYISRDRAIFGYQTSDSTVTTAADAHLDPSPTPAGTGATRLNTAPIAILIDGQTASAAEGVVVAFIGRGLTQSFGASTLGVPTGNSDHAGGRPGNSSPLLPPPPSSSAREPLPHSYCPRCARPTGTERTIRLSPYRPAGRPASPSKKLPKSGAPAATRRHHHHVARTGAPCTSPRWRGRRRRART